MSRAIAAFHGRFGRATLYQLNRPFNVHAHREGHLIFHLGGADGRVDVDGRACPVTSESVVAVSPWEPHNFIPSDLETGGAVLHLLRRPRMVRARRRRRKALLRRRRSSSARPSSIARSAPRRRRSSAGERLGELDGELRGLIDACYEESWRQTDQPTERRALDGVTDFRVRKSIRLLEEAPVADIELDAVARESGLSRPHFYKLFRDPDGPDAEPVSQHPADGAGARQARAQRGAGGGDRLRPRLSLAERVHQVLRVERRDGADGLPPRRACLVGRDANHTHMQAGRRQGW